MSVENPDHITGDASQSLARLAPTPMDIVAANPNMDVDKLERLLAMQREITAESRRMAYVEAMTRLAPILPEIDRNGHVTHETKNGIVDRRYAKMGDIDRAIRPLYTAEGFSISWKTAVGENGKIRMIGRCSHVGGHAEDFPLDLPHDSSGSKNPVQAVKSTMEYGRRIITIMIFNLRVSDEDTDGNGPPTAITNDEALNLKAALEEVGGDMKAFLAYFEIEKLADLSSDRLKDALQMIADKRKKGARK
jgi:hypothetical protein